MNILCTGNPNNKTVASGVKNFWPNADFVSRATGFDLMNWTASTQQMFRNHIIKYNVFINSSFVYPGVQLNLLNEATSAWMQADCKGHIVNIGTTMEWQTNDKMAGYINSKLALRSRSLELNEQTGITGIKTSYIIVGGINDGAPGNNDKLEISSIVRAIDWILTTKERIGLLQIETVK